MNEWIIKPVKLLRRMKRHLKKESRFFPAPEWHNNWIDPEWLERYLSPKRKEFYHEVISMLPIQPICRLDVGCGCGYFLRLLGGSNLSKQSTKLIGLDVSDTAVRAATRLCPEASIIHGSIYQIPFADDSVDLIMCIEVLEHLFEPKRALREMMRALQPKGQLLITVPDGDIDQWEGHNNFWGEAAFREFLAPYRLRTLERIDGGRTFVAILYK